MSELPEGEEIVVTGTRFRDDDDALGGGSDDFGEWLFWSVYVPDGAPDPFEQYGGNQNPEIARFELIDGNVIVTLAGYDFQLKVPAADWARMGEQERGDLIKMLNEFPESPMMRETFDRIQAQHLAQVEIRYDNVVHLPDGTTEPWNTNPGVTQYGEMKPAYATNADGSPDYSRLTAVIININPATVPGPDGHYDSWTNTQGEVVQITFALVFAHEIRHTFYPGNVAGEETQVQRDADTIMDQIYQTPGQVERSPIDYLRSQTWIGSYNNDNATGSTGNDTMSGLSGNDTLNGGAGNDLVMGGAGMDVLSGGTGSNYVLGGLDADVYAPEAGVSVEVLGELGGIDRVDLSRISIQDVIFTRFGDDLRMVYAGALGLEEVYVEKQWLEGYKIEQFTFAEGTFASSYIEELAGGGPGGVCYDGPNPVICGPYGLPVVLDLDGDGIELIEIGASKARFDVDGDGARDRMGWVGADDGILALDRNGNGRIDDFSEISFLQDFLGAGSDLEGLFAYDTNHDGYLTASDSRFSEFVVWRDLNANGHSEKHELFTLSELGIVSIGLERHNIQALDVGADRNQILASASFKMADGRSFEVGDVALFTAMSDCECHSGSSVAEFVPLFEGNLAWIV